jgi:hypothetical protein
MRRNLAHAMPRLDSGKRSFVWREAAARLPSAQRKSRSAIRLESRGEGTVPCQPYALGRCLQIEML